MSKSTSFARKSAGPSSLLSHSLFTIQLLFALQPLQAHPQSLAHSSQLQPSAFSPSSLQHTYTSTHTHHRKMSHLTNSKWHKTLLPPIHSIRDYDALTMCQAQNTELRVRSQTWSTLLHLEVYSQGQWPLNCNFLGSRRVLRDWYRETKLSEVWVPFPTSSRVATLFAYFTYWV